MFDMDTMQQFEITALNPDLVQSHAQVYSLRAIARQFFCAERVQSLTVQNHVEKARCITHWLMFLYVQEVCTKY